MKNKRFCDDSDGEKEMSCWSTDAKTHDDKHSLGWAWFAVTPNCFRRQSILFLATMVRYRGLVTVPHADNQGLLHSYQKQRATQSIDCLVSIILSSIISYLLRMFWNIPRSPVASKKTLCCWDDVVDLADDVALVERGRRWPVIRRCGRAFLGSLASCRCGVGCGARDDVVYADSDRLCTLWHKRKKKKKRKSMLVIDLSDETTPPVH